MANRIYNIVLVLVLALMLASYFLATSHSQDLREAPTFPNAATGQTISITVRGVGTVYVDQKEWNRIGPYWNTFYALAGLFAALGFGRILLEGLKPFIQKWRYRK